MRTFVIAAVATSTAGLLALASGCSKLDPDSAGNPPDFGVDASYSDAAVEQPTVDTGTEASPEASPDAPSEGGCTGASCCGNGTVDDGEACDTAIVAGFPGACPTSCANPDSCHKGELQNAGTCQATCGATAVTKCDANFADNCCPSNCSMYDDFDCTTPTCGNGAVEPGETCDTGITSGDGKCPTQASDCSAAQCASAVFVAGSGGTGAACRAACVQPASAATCSASGTDGCCASSCNASSDSDCAAGGQGAACVDLAQLGTASASTGSGPDGAAALNDGKLGCNLYTVNATGAQGNFVQIDFPSPVAIAAISIDSADKLAPGTTLPECGTTSNSRVESGTVQVLSGGMVVTSKPFTTNVGDTDLDLGGTFTGDSVRILSLQASNMSRAAIHEVYVWPTAGCTAP